MKTINYGKVNDCMLFATMLNGSLTPLSKVDIRFVDADYCIRYDSGVYPGATSVEQHICDQVAADLAAVSQAASAMGRIGGSAKTDVKSTASRTNGKLGGRPHKTQTEKEEK